MAAAARTIPAEFSNWLWGRRYRVDAEGVTESDRYGNQCCFIPWRELERCGPTLVGRGGQAIELRLGKDQVRKLLTAANAEWRARYPDAYRRGLGRAFRQLWRVTFVFLPLLSGMNLAILLAIFGWKRAAGLPTNAWAAGLFTLGHLVGLSAVCWLYFYRWRPFYVREMWDSGEPAGPQPGREPR